jgi:hypothetical protein
MKNVRCDALQQKTGFKSYHGGPSHKQPGSPDK